VCVAVDGWIPVSFGGKH